MVESRYVLYGLVSGGVSGVFAGIVTYLTTPSVDVVLEQVKSSVNISGVPEDVLRGYLSIGLLLAPIIVFVFALILGAVFGALYGYLDKKIPGPPLVSAVLTGAIYAGLLILPNIVLGASQQKIMANSGWVLSYTLALIALTIYKSPRESKLEQVRYTGIERQEH